MSKEVTKDETKEVTKEVAKQEFDPMIEYIETNENVWYLNIHGAQMRVWDNLYKHGVIHTWNKDYRYNSMYRKLNKATYNMFIFTRRRIYFSMSCIG